MEPQGLLPPLQEPTTGPQTEADEFGPHPPTVTSVGSVLILPFRLCLCLRE